MKKFTTALFAILLALSLLSVSASAATPPVDWDAGAPPVSAQLCHYDFSGGTYIRYSGGNPEALESLDVAQMGYYHTVIDIQPWRALHRFDGWQAADGAVYHAGDRLPSGVTELRAVWVRTWALPKIDIKIPWILP